MNDLAELKKFAKRYAEAWCSQDSEKVAAFFAENGSLSVNNEPPAVGRAAIAKEARGFMTTFPDMVVTFDRRRVAAATGHVVGAARPSAMTRENGQPISL